MRMLLSLAPLLFSILLMQLSTGGVGPLDALKGLEHDFSKAQIGYLGSAHFLGFFIGCWWSPRLMGIIGHSRTFSAFAAIGAISLLAHVFFINPYSWSMLRIGSGFCVAGCYTVIESWLQSKVSNDNRGRVLGIYRIVDISGSLVAQLMIGLIAGLELYIAYNLLTILCCAALLPMTLTQAKQPIVPSAPRLQPRLAIQLSPLAVASVIVSGLTMATFRMVGPLYGSEMGLAPGQIGGFLALFVVGGAVAQFPAGWLADKYDRRTILILLSVLAVLSSIFSIFTGPLGSNWLLINTVFFGFVTFPIYSVATAHAHDFAKSEQRVSLSAALMFFYAVGAIASPIISARLIDIFAPSAMFAFIATAHTMLIIFAIWRQHANRQIPHKTPYLYTPRTSFTIGTLLKRLRDKNEKSEGD